MSEVKFFECRQPGKLMALRHNKLRSVGGPIEVQSQEKPQEGTVVAVHPDSRYRVGETIVWNRFAAEFGARPEGPQKEYLVIREDDILGVINETEWNVYVERGKAEQAEEIAVAQRRNAARQGLLGP